MSFDNIPVITTCITTFIIVKGTEEILGNMSLRSRVMVNMVKHKIVLHFF